MKLVIIIFIKAYIVLSSIINLVEPDKIIRSTVSQTVQKDINIKTKSNQEIFEIIGTRQKLSRISFSSRFSG